MAAHARIAWLLNLDAERELQDPARYRPSLAGAVSEWSSRMADLIAADDWVIDDRVETASTIRDVPAETFALRIFCPTPSALARAVALGFSAPPAPTFAILRSVNDRAFCAALGQRLTGAYFARDMTALLRHLEQPSFSGNYVIKRAFSFAGREQRRIRQATLDASSRGFCLHSFARGEGLQIEPWVERLADFSRHGYLTRTGALSIGATREQHCDSFGRFQSVSTAPARISAAEDAQLAEELKLTAAALTAAGYFGPFGIDAFRYQLPDGAIGFNPRCEINARFTMGYPRALLLDGSAQDS
jgi:hypothetical protein